ncbi:uncharacterized protein LOC129788177 [Lutzomyia longipalpis]|uniref:uncharacterized protein LOC129788177 n=1 Tax=Lutzomyia longipalpis TaxID=7200 RepID=UPI0024833C34|nr:uncharacterized protein LOC129788177 [Lutzomyia longipalpis]
MAGSYSERVQQAFDLNDRQFYFQFHLTKPLVRLLISDIREFAPPPRSISGIPLELKVLVFLNFLASGGYQKRVGSTFLLQLSQASVSRIVDEMSRIVAVNLKSRYIIFPSTVEEVNKKKEGNVTIELPAH